MPYIYINKIFIETLVFNGYIIYIIFHKILFHLK
jgi:hypothetical protein